MFDTQIAYVAESGVGDARVSRIAVMDSDGYNHHSDTGGTMVLTPRLAPKAARLAYVSFVGGRPRFGCIDLGFRRATATCCPSDAITFAPRYSPDGSRIVFSMMLGANSDIYVVGERRAAAAADDIARRSTPIRAFRPTAARSCSKATAADRSNSTS